MSTPETPDHPSAAHVPAAPSAPVAPTDGTGAGSPASRDGLVERAGELAFSHSLHEGAEPLEVLMAWGLTGHIRMSGFGSYRRALAHRRIASRGEIPACALVGDEAPGSSVSRDDALGTGAAARITG